MSFRLLLSHLAACSSILDRIFILAFFVSCPESMNGLSTGFSPRWVMHVWSISNKSNREWPVLPFYVCHQSSNTQVIQRALKYLFWGWSDSWKAEDMNNGIRNGLKKYQWPHWNECLAIGWFQHRWCSRSETHACTCLVWCRWLLWARPGYLKGPAGAEKVGCCCL